MILGERPSNVLPERFAELYIPGIDRFETPVDDRGLADVDAIFELALRTYPEPLPDFSDRNVHHIYWTEEWWKQFAASQSTPEDKKTVEEFRDGAPQKAYIPLPLHQWIEVIMIPPAPPSIEVMRRRNAAWEAASVLLRGADLVEKARVKYAQNKHVTRRVIGYLEGLSPAHMKNREDLIVTDREYLLSQLNAQLEGWQKTAKIIEARNIPKEDRFIELPRLWEVRALKRRIRNQAVVPRVPASIIAA